MAEPKTRDGLRVEREAGIVTLTLDRPERRNAIDVPLWKALTETLREVAGREDDRVLVLTGAAGNFCAGGDLLGGGPRSEAGVLPADPVDAAVSVLRETVNATCLALHHLPVPSIAAVEGTAAGAGANLAVACDLVVAGESARFGWVFVRRALPVDSGGSWLLPRLVGLQRAKALALTGDWLSAPDAAAQGLVTRVVPDGGALDAARELAATLAGHSASALAATKQLLDASPDGGLGEALEREALALGECVTTEEFRRALAEFARRGR